MAKTDETKKEVVNATEPIEEPVTDEVPQEDFESKYNELNDRYLRTLAEYDNFRKRTTKERESLYLLAKADTVERILPVFDNLERAAANPSQDESYKKGVELILQQMKEIFTALGVSEIEAEGVPFNPEKHNAVMHIESADHDTNMVSEIFQKGFEIEDKVIRYATVQVAN